MEAEQGVCKTKTRPSAGTTSAERSRLDAQSKRHHPFGLELFAFCFPMMVFTFLRQIALDGGA
jgi:hypothetical protein